MRGSTVFKDKLDSSSHECDHTPCQSHLIEPIETKETVDRGLANQTLQQ